MATRVRKPIGESLMALLAGAICVVLGFLGLFVVVGLSGLLLFGFQYMMTEIFR